MSRELWPVNFVSWYDAARFTNWLTTGNTESGVTPLLAPLRSPSEKQFLIIRRCEAPLKSNFLL
ncbi:MAG: hypothetical protein FJ395_17895 [Verrucomicrobia bacterium]|nr:hypothetical protein [Verrucomicrobiota bacterium]